MSLLSRGLRITFLLHEVYIPQELRTGCRVQTTPCIVVLHKFQITHHARCRANGATTYTMHTSALKCKAGKVAEFKQALHNPAKVAHCCPKLSSSSEEILEAPS